MSFRLSLREILFSIFLGHELKLLLYSLNARKALRENTSRGGDMALSSVSANGAAQKSGGVHVVSISSFHWGKNCG